MMLAVLLLVILCVTVSSAATAPVDCPAGCSCLSQADAKAKGYDSCSGQLTLCGYNSAQNPMYCYKTGLTVAFRTVTTISVPTTAPPASCPQGCECLSNANAQARYGTSYTKCSADICGYEQSTATLAAVEQVPKYCVKPQAPTPVCPEGCSCMVESAAKEKFGVYTRCSETPCYSAVTGAAAVNAYCFKQGQTPTPVTCPQGCDCISDATAKAKSGIFTRCSEDICGYEQSTATVAAVVQVPKYCMKQEGPSPVCPEGCACLPEDDAKLKGLEQCDNSQTPCGYQSVTATANTQASRKPLYCYKAGITTITPQPICPDGCYCMNEAEAKAKFTTYTRCSEKTCGYDQSATTANGVPRYCFKPVTEITVTPTPSQCGGGMLCPKGCTCISGECGKQMGYQPCRGGNALCGYDLNKMPLYCFEKVPNPSCLYDYQKNACTGTCPQGGVCKLAASSTDATGKIDYAICDCGGQPKDQCSFDKEKQVCTGTCQNGGAGCAIIGKEVNSATGEAKVICGCPGAGCTFDYSKDACVGTCQGTGQVCQLNTIYRDPETGKVTFAECHCKGTGEIPPATCSCDPKGGACTGTCPAPQSCVITNWAPGADKMCTTCECMDVCRLDAQGQCAGTCPNNGACTLMTKVDTTTGKEGRSCNCEAGAVQTPPAPAPDVLTSISTFFRSLFGGK